MVAIQQIQPQGIHLCLAGFPKMTLYAVTVCPGGRRACVVQCKAVAAVTASGWCADGDTRNMLILAQRSKLPQSYKRPCCVARASACISANQSPCRCSCTHNSRQGYASLSAPALKPLALHGCSPPHAAMPSYAAYRYTWWRPAAAFMCARAHWRHAATHPSTALARQSRPLPSLSVQHLFETLMLPD